MGKCVEIIGGLVSSTLLTLVVVPCVFSLVAGLKLRLSKRFRKVDAAPAHNATAG